jgi:hypothetical protein
MNRFAVFACIALLIAPSASVHAQAGPRKLPGCTGIPAVLRTSSITGTMAQFEAAVAAHRKWYRDRGITFNDQRVVPVYRMVDTTISIDPTQVMTIHTNPPATNPPRDAAWEAFTKMYADVSKVTSQTVACLPQLP